MPRRPPFDYGPLITSLKNAIDEKGLQPVPIFIKKNIELYEMICADSASFLAFSELQLGEDGVSVVSTWPCESLRVTPSVGAGHRGIKYLRTSKVACMCFECCDCVLMREVEQKAREEGIVPLNKLARYEAEEVRRRVNLGKDVPAVLALLPERSEKDRKKGYFGAQVEGWCLARRAEFTDPVDGC